MRQYVPNKLEHGSFIPDFLHDDERLTVGAMATYGALVSYAYKKHFCFPSKETLMSRVHCTYNTLQKYLSQLVEYGYLKMTKMNGRTIYYLFAPEENQKNLDSDFTELSKIETEIKEIKLINNTPPVSPSLGNKQNGHCETPLIKTSNPIEGDFNLFWNVYPKKENKPSAFKKFSILKRKGLLPTLEFFKKAIEFFKNSKQWNRENGRYIPHFSNFLENEKWQEVPMEFFEQKKDLSVHQNLISVAEATKQWEMEKQQYISSQSDKVQQTELLERNWKEFQSNFKIDRTIKRFIAKAKFFELSLQGFFFGMIEKNLNITPMEYLETLKI